MNDFRPGRPFPQGASWDGAGTNFSLWSERAERVELCLFDEDGAERRFDVCDRTAHQWHIYERGVGPGQRYGYRIDLRQTEPVFRRRDFLVGEDATGSGLPDVVWMRPDGEQMNDEDWARQNAHRSRCS